jgi:predicted DsbA family dithiol-disulfide isomerase
MEEYISTGKVYFTYRSMGNFVSDNLARSMGTSANTESQDAALAAYCAGDQNKFWEMQTYLFANVLGENVGSFTDRRIKVIAEKVGLDMDQFSDCYGSEKYAKDIQQDFADGQAAGIMGVPSFLLTYTVDGVTINRLIEGAQPFSSFQQELETILDEIGAQ